MKDLRRQAAIVAKLATLERVWTTYISLPEATYMIIPNLTSVVNKLQALGLNFTIIYVVLTFIIDAVNCFQIVCDIIYTTETTAYDLKICSKSSRLNATIQVLLSSTKFFHHTMRNQILR